MRPLQNILCCQQAIFLENFADRAVKLADFRIRISQDDILRVWLTHHVAQVLMRHLLVNLVVGVVSLNMPLAFIHL